MKRLLPLLIKVLIVVLILAAGLVIWSTCSGTSCIQRIDNTLPDAVTAPYQILTKTKSYYAQQAYENDDQSVTMLRWYERIDDKWVLHGDPITIPALLQPNITGRN